MTAPLVALVRAIPDVDDATCSVMARAWQAQLRHVELAWDMRTSWQVEFFADAKAVPAGAMVLTIRESAPEPGVLGDHDEAGGVPRGEICWGPIRDHGGALLNGPNSLSATGSHEILEMRGNPWIQRWWQMPDGRLTAGELADGVEGNAYPLRLRTGEVVSVSNWLLPAWMGDGAGTDRFDFLGVTGEPFQLAPGGYMVVMQPRPPKDIFADRGASHGGTPGLEHLEFVFGDAFPEWKRDLKRAGRVARRAAA